MNLHSRNSRNLPRVRSPPTEEADQDSRSPTKVIDCQRVSIIWRSTNLMLLISSGWSAAG